MHRNLITALVTAVALGLIAQVFVGFQLFPFGDDFAYAPLAELKADPSLFPRDDQLRLFANHAQVYEWLYALGSRTLGVAAVFAIALALLAVVSAVGLQLVLRGFGVRAGFALPVVLALGVVSQLDGLGRGDFGGLISTFFHHHGVAMAAVLAAIAAASWNRFAVAGMFLGLSVYAQPMTALHGAMIVGLGVLLYRPKAVPVLVLVTGLVAAPAVVTVLGQLAEGGAVPAGFDLIRDAYRFRAPAHYDPSWRDIGVTTLYLLAGWIGTGMLAQAGHAKARLALGLVGALTALHLVTVVIYKMAASDWLTLYVLDANRSSALVFVLGPVLAIAGVTWVRRSTAGYAVALLLTAILLLNGTLASVVFLGIAGLVVLLERMRWGHLAVAAASVVAAGFLFPPSPFPPSLPGDTRAVLDRIKAETPVDALFVIPVGMMEFRQFAQRSAYVDFKLFSVAQPDQAVLTRSRIEQVTRPPSDLRGLTGWGGVALWDEAQQAAATCDVMGDILRETGADFYVRPVSTDEVPPECAALPMSISSSTLAVYGPLK